MIIIEPIKYKRRLDTMKRVIECIHHVYTSLDGYSKKNNEWMDDILIRFKMYTPCIHVYTFLKPSPGWGQITLKTDFYFMRGVSFMRN